MKKRRKWTVDNRLVKPISSYYNSPSSGATLPHPNMYPDEFIEIGINMRNSDRNEYYGMVVTNPPNDTSKLVFGFSYLDGKDNQTDEDIYVFDIPKLEIEYFPKGTYEKENDLYVRTHKGIKDYLLPIPKK